MILQKNIKMTNTIKEKYNTNCTLKLDYVKNKTNNTKIENFKEKYNINIISKNENILICKCDKKHIYEISTHLLYDRTRYNVEPCTICNPIGVQYSAKEKEILNFIKENYNGKIIENDRKILNGKELDIYLPDLNLAFEFNGDYWHSTIYKDQNYHLNKSKLCLIKNIDLIHIFEFEWNNNKEIIKNIILSKINKYNYINNKYIFNIDNFIFEDKCFNLYNKNNKIGETGSIIINVGYDIELPGYNIYKK